MNATNLRDYAHALEKHDRVRWRCLVGYLREQADAMESAAPAQSAKVEPRCEQCRSWTRTVLDDGLCHRFPQAVAKAEADYCDEFHLRVVTP